MRSTLFAPKRTRVLVLTSVLVLFVLIGLTSALGASASEKMLAVRAALFPAAQQPALPADLVNSLAPLKTAPIVLPRAMFDYVRDTNAATRLGKALFWEMQMGSDGSTACASCHFHAGADSRAGNQLNPGADSTFQTAGPNHTLEPRDFPLTRHANEFSPSSPITRDSNDVVGSHGVFRRDYRGLLPGSSDPSVEDCTKLPDDVFNIHGVNVRRSTGRNTPPVVNAVFNFRQFWDGRASDIFNGVNPLGSRDPNARIYKTVNGQGDMQQVAVAIPNASLASQAVGPPGSPVEMNCGGRPFAAIGKKLLNLGLKPLGKQDVARDDSVLGPIAASRLNPPGKGLTTTYKRLVQNAFKPEYWNSPQQITLGTQQFTQMEANFSLFWGLAIMLYEATLVSDDTPFDRYLEGQPWALTAQQQRGLAIFAGGSRGTGECAECHFGAELTGAATSVVQTLRLERMKLGDGGCGIYDVGFYNIGVRPTGEDLGRGGLDPFGDPLSDIRMAMLGKSIDYSLVPQLGQDPACDGRANVDGAFKTPGLRNVELTGPYFHNGGKATLRQVVDFYNRGGDFAQENLHELDPSIEALGLTSAQSDDLVAFLLSLTDERVRWEKAPFDHPSLCIPDGAIDPGPQVTQGEAADVIRCLPAVGAAGAAEPLKRFLDLDPFISDTGAPPPPPTPTFTWTPTPTSTSTPTPPPATATPTFTPTPAACSVAVNVPALSRNRGFYYTFTSQGAGPISARWTVPVLTTGTLAIYAGNPFGGQPNPTSSAPPAGALATTTGFSTSFSVTKASVPAGVYTVYFFDWSVDLAATSGQATYTQLGCQ